MTLQVVFGGEGSCLTPSAIFNVANNCLVRVDSSALHRTSSALGDQTYHFDLPEFFTAEQCRATLAVILNKLVLISSPSSISIMEILNSTLDSIPSFNIVDVTGEEKDFLKSCVDALDGVCAIIDHKISSLCAVADMIAALSCEASKAVLSGFVIARCEDVSTLRNYARRSFAFDFLALLKGSKLVGKSDVKGVSCIPTVHSSLRAELSKLQSRTRVTLNSADMETTKETWFELLSTLMSALLNYGKSSLSRAQSNVESVRDDTMKSSLRRLIAEQCPTGECLDNVVSEALNEEYARFLHLVDKLVGLVRTILSWEMTAALVSLEAELHLGGDGVSDGDPNSCEKKRGLMGPRTGAVMLFIEEQLNHIPSDGSDQLARLLKLAELCELVLTPKEKESQNFARLLNIPRDIPYCMAFHPLGERRNRGSIIPANFRGNIVGLVDCGADTPSEIHYCEGKVYCEGGYTISTDVPLSDIYQNARYGRFKYHLTLSSGFYSVSLYFAETLNVEAQEGIRVFDVRMNGESALSGFDIGKEFGFLTPCGLIDCLVVLKGEDEGLVIDFDPRVGSALVNAICVRKLPVCFGWWVSNTRATCEFCGQEVDVPIEAVAQVESDLRAKYDRELKLYEKTLETESLSALLGKYEEYMEYYDKKMAETREYFEECRKKGKEYIELLKKQLADVKGVRLGERDILKELGEIDKIRPYS